MYRIGQVAAQLDISPSMLRRWSERFAEWLSEDAINPQQLENGRYAPTTYNDDDLEVLQTIQELTQKGLSHDEIEAHLSNGEEGDSDEESRLAIREGETPDLFMKRTAAAALGQALHQLNESQQALLNSQNAHRDLLNVVINDAMSLKQENERLRKRLRKLEEEMARLKESDWNHRLTLEERLNDLERHKDQKRSLWDRLVGR